MDKNEVKQLHVIIHRALVEDIGDGDITTVSTVPGRSILKGTFIAKESGIIAGLEVVVIDANTKLRQFKQELVWNDCAYGIKSGWDS